MTVEPRLPSRQPRTRYTIWSLLQILAPNEVTSSGWLHSCSGHWPSVLYSGRKWRHVVRLYFLPLTANWLRLNKCKIHVGIKSAAGSPTTEELRCQTNQRNSRCQNLRSNSSLCESSQFCLQTKHTKGRTRPVRVKGSSTVVQHGLIHI